MVITPATARQFWPTRASYSMVASADGLASQVGKDILMHGGNAVDAAVAVGLALAVTYPEAGNLGGGGFMLIRMADGTNVAIDYREVAPLASNRDMYLDTDGSVLPNASTVGYRASGVPGTVAGLALALKKYGRLPWREVVEPARRLAAEGFVVTPEFAGKLRSAHNLAQFAESRRIFLNNGRYYVAGDRFKQPELAATLQRLQQHGPGEFYTGRTAELIAQEMRAHGGLITRQDLAQYRAVVRTPLRGTYRGYEILTMPPPSSGGIALLEALNILERYDLRAMGPVSAAADHLLVEAMRRAFADRAQFAGDADFVKVPVDGLISKSYAATLAKTIDPQHATPSADVRHGEPTGYESPQTTHFVVVDAQGNAVSNTYTLNLGYGSGVTVAGAGFLLNDEMDDFTSKPNTPNAFGLIQGEANAIQPQKRPLSSMTPTIVLHDGKLFCALGTPGGPTIITTVLQILVNVIDHSMNIQEAVNWHRLHHQWQPDRILYEPSGIPPNVMEALRQMGHVFSKDPTTIGDAQAILIDPRTGDRLGASDPREPNGRAVGY
jgi:gamma-glutamyltranspeptidase/glutathione hydrolase